MLFSPFTNYANFSHNKFIDISCKRFNPAYKTLTDSSEVFLNIPLNLDELALSNNVIVGKLPNPFPCEYIRHFAIGNNLFSGDLPDFLTYNPLLRKLDLSNQEQTETGGLSGTIPIDMFKLSNLVKLDLSQNSLAGPAPSTIGNLIAKPIYQCT
ncbi:hypothetical protein ACHAXA_011745 [Cyclostephanos tholiformis]|uniref:Uncharacterized protein n=1 Tax=Cyclostephanos tholiformis TaxID=382380 RepID=A0ABD3R216_9STRA